MDSMNSNNINLSELDSNIDNIINNTLLNDFNINIYDYKELNSIKHNTIDYCLTKVFTNLFQSNNYDYSLFCYKSIIDFDDIELFSFLVHKFISICQRFNKSLGLVSFGAMVGVPPQTISEWVSDEGRKLNPARAKMLQNLREVHKARHISLLNDSVVGQIAVANNDAETGLNWAEKQQQTTATKEVYFLPSERIERLRITQQQGTEKEGQNNE